MDITVSTTNPTYADVGSVALLANKTYFIQAILFGNRAGAATGLGTVRLFYSGSVNTDNVLVSSNVFAAASVTNAGLFDLDAAAAATSFTTTAGVRYDLTGYIRTTTAGTLTLQAARATGNITNDLSVKRGSFIIATPAP